jgi:tRNA pseudouridine38-40 synthase|tara:strand:- start:2543 stop:3283 length:741 start_codon:yes stop_codon:yes gene_type:complete
MFRYQIKIEYDGTDFVGWQYQKNGKSVQGVLQKILLQFLKKKIIVVGSGRTDSGVHAIEQSAHIDLEKKIFEKKKFLQSLNFYLRNYPIAITDIKEKDQNFHARHSAKKRTYKYLIINRMSPPVLKKNRAWHIRKKLDVKVMKKGSKMLLGTHDFSTFRTSSCQAKSPVKTMEKISIKKSKDKITLKFVSRSFLQQQVRSMVGCIKYLGEGKWSVDNFKKSFKSKKRSNCAPPAPACGLYLERIKY